jgi:hypothetical protein
MRWSHRVKAYNRVSNALVAPKYTQKNVVRRPERLWRPLAATLQVGIVLSVRTYLAEIACRSATPTRSPTRPADSAVAT